MSNTWWKNFDELKKEQAELLDIPTDRSLLIKGPPGSGKTNLLLLRANQLAIGDRPNLNVVVFGSLLKQFIQMGGLQYNFPNEKIVTHARLFSDILRAENAGFADRSMTLPEARQERANRLEELVKSGVVGFQFDALLLDEAQDYTPQEIRILRSLTEVLVVTADRQQAIFNVDDCTETLENCVDEVHNLKYHFRNGLDICRVADGLQKGKPDYSPMLQCSNYDEAAYPSRVFPKSGLTLEEQAVAIARQVKEQRFAYPDDLIGVLCPKNADLDVIADKLESAGLGSETTRANTKDLFDSSKPVWLSTLSAAKSLEFRAVHIAGLDELHNTGPVQKRLIFTGVTRAKTALSLYWHTSIPGYLESALLTVAPHKSPVTKQQIFGKT